MFMRTPSEIEVDKLVVQAFKVKLKSKNERKEIESFTHVLSDMHSSLKAWVPRFQNALSSPSVGSEDQFGQSSPSQTFPTANEEVSYASDSPEQLELESLVSPSPLVSWCADRTVENGRQLFLLTPLPKSRALSSKHQSLSRSVFERVTHMDAPPNTSLGLPSLLTISGNTNDDLLEGIDIKPTPKKFSSSVTEMEGTLECGFLSTPKFPNRDKSVFLMTPRLKMSPPKSCVLLEPISEHQDFNNNRKSTPFPVRSQTCSPSETSEPSSSYVSESLALKYPELFGINQKNKSGIRRKEIDTSLDWFMSPPKSCVLIESPSDKLKINLAPEVHSSDIGPVLDEKSTCVAAVRNKDFQAAFESTAKYWNQELPGASTTVLESTPMWKEPESTIRTGKRLGENTLKRELWTKFEAASSNVLRFDVSFFQETSTKGFLDRLEESCITTASTKCPSFHILNHHLCIRWITVEDGIMLFDPTLKCTDGSRLFQIDGGLTPSRRFARILVQSRPHLEDLIEANPGLPGWFGIPSPMGEGRS
ncbi:hypothetical protein BVC80_1791g69 [Macleaya cordata]|uniref:Uncharacterized protein n=1 Tax=Macleaya cordata TaxID=56857 RepID=A0A200QPX8_MACCD|nr:hypothetical protein BVC80_1791g69 [Macleaya cordata]